MIKQRASLSSVERTRPGHTEERLHRAALQQGLNRIHAACTSPTPHESDGMQRTIDLGITKARAQAGTVGSAGHGERSGHELAA